jgi:hypothetical protein
MSAGWRLGYADVGAAIAALSPPGTVFCNGIATGAVKLSTLASAGYSEGQLAYIATVGAAFRLEFAALTVDGITVVAATGKAGYQWVRLLQPNPIWWTPTNWYVDNAAGSDENSGAIGLPLATFQELYRRLFRAILSVSPTVNVLSDVPDADTIMFDCDPGPTAGGTITIQGQTTIISTNVVTVAQARSAAANQANEITTAADLSAHVGKQARVQGTSNYAGITKAVAAGTLRLGELINTATFAVAASGGVTAGQTIEVVDYTKGPLRIRNLGRSALAIQDFRPDGTGGVNITEYENTSAGIYRRVIFGGTTGTTIIQARGGNNFCLLFRKALAHTAAQSCNHTGSSFIGTGLHTFTALITALTSCVSQNSPLQINRGDCAVTGDFGQFDLATGVGIGWDAANNFSGHIRYRTGRHYGSGNGAPAGFLLLSQQCTGSYLLAQPPTCDAGTGVTLATTNFAIGALPVALNVNNGTAFYGL